MRHFLRAAQAVGVLSGRVLAGPAERPLVARPRPLQRFASPNRGTVSDTVDLSVIAPPADAYLLVTACTVEEPVPVPDRHPAAPGLDRSARSGHAPRRAVRALRSPIAMTDEARADAHPPGLRLF
jgi:hypothetical protein